MPNRAALVASHSKGVGKLFSYSSYSNVKLHTKQNHLNFFFKSTDSDRNPPWSVPVQYKEYECHTIPPFFRDFSLVTITVTSYLESCLSKI